MKALLLSMALMLSVSATNTQRKEPKLNPENKIFIITLDGLRWEEVFRGADPKFINDPSLADTALTKALYWANSQQERRRKLMPFFWNVLARQGQLYGN